MMIVAPAGDETGPHPNAPLSTLQQQHEDIGFALLTHPSLTTL